MQGRLEDLEDFTRTSSSSSHKDMYKIMLTPLTACHKDLYKTMHCKDLFEDFGRISARSPETPPKRISQDLYKRNWCGWRGSYKILIYESLPQELSYKRF